jgi:hypothetical protein
MNGTDASQPTSAQGSLAARIHPQNAEAFDRLDSADQQAMLSLCGQVRLSLQTEREFLEWLPEIAYLAGQTVATVLDSPEIRKAMNSTDLNAPQKIEKIRACIFSLRFPRYDAALKRWKQVANRTFGSMPGVAISPSPYFEKNKVELRITLTGAEQAREIMEKLGAISQETWESLIDPLKQD